MSIDFDKTYKTYQPKLLTMIRGRVKDRDSAEDLVQEVFIKVHRFSAYYDNKYSLSTWLYQITFNVLKNFYKAQKNFISYRSEVYDNEHTELLADPKDILIAAEVEAVLVGSINKLDSKYMNVYTLREVEGMTYKNIATHLGITEGCVKSRLKRARDFIAKELQ